MLEAKIEWNKKFLKKKEENLNFLVLITRLFSFRKFRKVHAVLFAAINCLIFKSDFLDQWKAPFDHRYGNTRTKPRYELRIMASNN